MENPSCAVYVGGISCDISQTEYLSEVQKWGGVIKAYYHGPNSGWGTVEFASRDIRDRFIENKARHILLHQIVDVKPYEICAEALALQHQIMVLLPVPLPDLAKPVNSAPDDKSKVKPANPKRRRELSPNTKAKMYSELKVLRATTLTTKGKKRAGYVKELALKYNVCSSYPSRLLRKIDTEGASIERRIRKGRPKVMTEDKVQHLHSILRSNEKKTIEQIGREIGVSTGALYVYMKKNKLLKGGKTVKPKTEEEKAKRASAKKRAKKVQQQINKVPQMLPNMHPHHNPSQSIPNMPILPPAPLMSNHQVPMGSGGEHFQHSYPEINWLSGFPQNHHHPNPGISFGQRPLS